MFLTQTAVRFVAALAANILFSGAAASPPSLTFLKTFDAQSMTGTLDLQTDRIIVSPGEIRKTRESSVYAYSGKDWFQALTAVDPEGRKHRQEITVLRGQSVVADHDTRTILITRKTPKVAKSDEHVGFVLGPSLPLGRGLSRLANLRDEGGKLVGTADDTGVLKARFMPSPKGLPVEIQRVLPEGYIVRWTYAGWRPLHGVWMPTHVESIPNKGELRIRAHYIIRKYNPVAPSSLEPVLIRPGFKLFDQRVEPQQAYGESELRSIAPNGVLTLERLLDASKARVAKMESAFAQGAQREASSNRSRSRSTAVAFAGVGLSVTGLIGFVYARRLLKRSFHNPRCLTSPRRHRTAQPRSAKASQ